MPRTILQIYAAAVCFASIACLAIAVGIVTYSTVAILNPAFTLHPMSIPPLDSPPFLIPGAMESSRAGSIVAVPPPSAEELSIRKAAALEAATRNELATARQSLLRWGISGAISGFLFFAHWRLLRRENANVA